VNICFFFYLLLLRFSSFFYIKSYNSFLASGDKIKIKYFWYLPIVMLILVFEDLTYEKLLYHSLLSVLISIRSQQSLVVNFFCCVLQNNHGWKRLLKKMFLFENKRLGNNMLHLSMLVVVVWNPGDETLWDNLHKCIMLETHDGMKQTKILKTHNWVAHT
jgi:hypothetical protein